MLLTASWLAKPFAAMIVCFICSCRRLRIGTPVTPTTTIASGWAAQIFAACDVVSVAEISNFSVLQTRCRKRLTACAAHCRRRSRSRSRAALRVSWLQSNSHIPASPARSGLATERYAARIFGLARSPVQVPTSRPGAFSTDLIDLRSQPCLPSNSSQSTQTPFRGWIRLFALLIAPIRIDPSSSMMSWIGLPSMPPLELMIFSARTAPLRSGMPTRRRRRSTPGSTPILTGSPSCCAWTEALSTPPPATMSANAVSMRRFILFAVSAFPFGVGCPPSGRFVQFNFASAFAALEGWSSDPARDTRAPHLLPAPGNKRPDFSPWTWTPAGDGLCIS